MDFNILIVDDEVEMCLSLAELFESRGYRAQYATGTVDAGAVLERESFDLILLDIRMPDGNGVDFLNTLKTRDSPTSVIMISAFASVDNVVKAMKYGAVNFYSKPIDMPALLEEISLISAGKNSASDSGEGLSAILTRTPGMEEIFTLIEKAAPTDVPVIITGESGTGKELAANSIHACSSRKGSPFIKLNCAAIPETLMESELFGHERGAFTDARERRKGKFEQASGGTIFFDEIGELNSGTQAKLLRVLQEKEFERLGGSEIISTNVRVLAATNKNLREMVKQGSFREDLYYRLSVITLELPPLRERLDDVPVLTDYFLKFFNKRYNKNIDGVDEKTRRLFSSHDWPGNIRELKNCLERAVIFCEGKSIGLSDLPKQYTEAVLERTITGTVLVEATDNLTRELIQDALDRSGGQKQLAAEILNIHRKTLYNKMKKLGMN
ncbi:MAG: sigma-54-dependent Fis family transcriptional regulator [Spirochaetes bacterium]|nr:MAG: sigma-54-dependent Fis family transcriptional regulator [Spirochaetota bacterium]RKX96509.1 MAG: sigma-54-dependent Fis family transcriptional regulator [Spirochaetota bacterium]